MISIITLQSTSLYLDAGVPVQETTGCSEVGPIMFLVDKGGPTAPSTNSPGIAVD